jgi:hypothetical protein
MGAAIFARGVGVRAVATAQPPQIAAKRGSPTRRNACHSCLLVVVLLQAAPGKPRVLSSVLQADRFFLMPREQLRESDTLSKVDFFQWH